MEAGIKEVQARLKIPATVFAIGLPEGMKQAEFEVYVRFLREEGIDPDASSRVEDSFGRKWVHVWDTREAAERFAARVRGATRNSSWEVYQLNPLPAPNGETPGTPGAIAILVGRQSDGNTYSLHPKSFRLLRQRFPKVSGQPTVSIGRYTQDNHEAIGGSIYDQVAALLTGLSPERLLDSFGGYRVVDPVSNLTLWVAKPAAS
jgi:hypothetical protein